MVAGVSKNMAHGFYKPISTVYGTRLNKVNVMDFLEGGKALIPN